MRFHGEIKGSKRPAIRRGSKASGIIARVGARTLGVEVRCFVDPLTGKDAIEVRAVDPTNHVSPESPLLRISQSKVTLLGALAQALQDARSGAAGGAQAAGGSQANRAQAEAPSPSRSKRRASGAPGKPHEDRSKPRESRKSRKAGTSSGPTPAPPAGTFADDLKKLAANIDTSDLFNPPRIVVE